MNKEGILMHSCKGAVCPHYNDGDCALDMKKFQDAANYEIPCCGRIGSFAWVQVRRRLEEEEKAAKKKQEDIADEQPEESNVQQLTPRVQQLETTEQQLPEYSTYAEYKDALKQELNKATESFVRIGYLLKIARDTNILKDSGYANMEEFAYAEFKIDKGTASKFIGINDRFSEGGYSDRLKTEYAGMGWSKLAVMLQLPDSINEEITPEFSKSEIQQIREEVAEEQKTTPLEHMLEGETPGTAQTDDLLHKVIYQLGESKPELYAAVYKAKNLNEIKEAMAPSGENIYSIRIRGIGRMLLSAKDYEDTVSLINERTGEKEKYSWKDVMTAWIDLTGLADGTLKETWSATYGKEFPEVAPAQPKKVEKVNTEKKESKPKPQMPEPEQKMPEPEPEMSEKDEKVTTAVSQQENPTLNDFIPDIPKPEEMGQSETAEEQRLEKEDMPETTDQEEMGQLPGQISIEDMPEVLPETDKMHKSYLEWFDISILRAKREVHEGKLESAEHELKEAMRLLKLLQAGEDDGKE
jgi:hypothetical protein